MDHKGVEFVTVRV